MRDSFRTFEWEKALIEPEVIVTQIQELMITVQAFFGIEKDV